MTQTQNRLDRASFEQEVKRCGIDVSRETLAQLQIYADLLVKWQKAINLVGPATIPDLWRRHFLDSAQLVPLLPAGDESGATPFLTDFGSGAGFPGLVLAIMTGRPVHLIDSDQRKCAFLTQVSAACGVQDRVQVTAARFDAVRPWPSRVITARACASLTDLFDYMEPFMTPETVLLLPKGRQAEDELTRAAAIWTMQVEKFPSLTDHEAQILRIRTLSRNH